MCKRRACLVAALVDTRHHKGKEESVDLHEFPTDHCTSSFSLCVGMPILNFPAIITVYIIL
jgi:hypothetical protein